MMNLKKAEKHIRKFLKEGLGLDLVDPHLVDTPMRVAKMYINEFFLNVDKEFNGYTQMPNTENYNEIIISDKINGVSVCSHHLLPFKFLAWMLYIPDETIVGASKFARVIDHYSKRPQTQERLCHQIIENFMLKVQPLGAMIVIRGHHGCMTSRGIKQHSNGFGTSAVRGVFKTHSDLEMKGYELIKLSLLMKE